MTPAISVILPTFNRPNLLHRAVGSVLAQTFPDFELIVVDDHSPEPASSVLSGLKDPRVTVIRHYRNLGGPAARNTGIIKSRAALIAFLDDDDEFLPRHLELLLRHMQSCPAKVGVVHGAVRMIDADGNLIRDEVPRFRGNIHSGMLRGIKDVNILALSRRKCFSDAGLFDETLSSCQDWDMWLRVSEHYDFDFIREVTAVYRGHQVQISTDLPALIRGRGRMVEKHRKAFAAEPGALRIHLKQIAKLNALNGTWPEAWGRFKEACGFDLMAWIKVVAWLLFAYPFAKGKAVVQERK